MSIMADTNSAVNITNSRFRASETPWVYTIYFNKIFSPMKLRNKFPFYTLFTPIIMSNR